MQATTKLLLTGAALCLSQLAHGHGSHRPFALHEHDPIRAIAQARAEHRLVLGYVGVDPDKGMPIFRWPDPNRRARIDVLVRETVVAELNTRDHGAVLAELGMNAPAWFLLDESGEVLWRREGRVDVDGLLGEIEGHLTGPAAVERVRAAVDAKGPSDCFARERLAAVLARTAEPTRAIPEYVWCIERGVAGDSLDAVARRPYAMSALATLAVELPEAARAASALQLEIESRLRRTADGDPMLARDLALMNRALGQDERTLRLFLALEPENRARHGLLDAVLAELVELGEYRAVLASILPLQAFRGEVALTRRTLVSRPSLAHQGDGRGTIAFTVARGLALAEVLAALDNADAVTLVDEVLAFSAEYESPSEAAETRAHLEARLVRSGNEKALSRLRERRNR